MKYIPQPERQKTLHGLIAYAAKQLEPMGAKTTGSQIIPLILGDEARAMAVASELQDAGLDVRGIRPPTVPIGSSRLRMSLTRNVGKADIERLAQTLRSVL